MVARLHVPKLYTYRNRKGKRMKKTLNYEKAFALLSDNATQFGIDRVVRDPADFIKRELNVSQFVALGYLKELERRGLIAPNFDGVRIASMRLLKRELPKRLLHEEDNMTRVLTALWKHRHGSNSDPKKQIVHSSFFGDIQGDADVLQNVLYLALQRFAENGWIKLEYSGMSRTPRLLYVVINDEFPTHLVQ